MKYWKGILTKSGQYGTMSDDGFVPDAVACSKAEYDAYISSLPYVPPVEVPTCENCKNYQKKI